MKAILRQTRISPKKANLIAELVRGKNVEEAVNILKFTPKKAAPVLKKLIESAAANAVNNFKQEESSLFIKEIVVTEGPTYKRSVPISRGRMHPILKRTSHITVKLDLSKELKKEQEKVEKAKTEEAKKETTKKKVTSKTTTK